MARNRLFRMQKAFTLIELLVVMAIIGILAGLTIPAVQSVRETARSLECQNNVRNLALGMLSYQAAFGAFPPGQLAPVDSDRDYHIDMSSSPMTGHLGFVLPFIEQQNVRSRFSEMNWGVKSTDAPWFTVPRYFDSSNVAIPIFRCPSDPHSGLKQLAVANLVLGPSPVNASFVIPVQDDFEGWTNYLGSKGAIQAWGVGTTPQSGIFFEQSRTRSRDITDGQSNTILLGEVLGGTTGSAEQRQVDIRHSIFQNGIGGDEFFFDETEDEVDNLVFMYSSSHRGGHLVNFAYADGHISIHPSSTERIVLQALTTRNGGEINEIE